MIAPDGEIFGPVNVIEVRACKNGFVVTAFYERGYDTDTPRPRGYESRVVDSHDPDKLAAMVAQVVREHPLSPNVFIAPVRKLP